MPLRPLKSFFPTADDVVNSDLPTLGKILLVHLKSYEGLNTVYQHAGLCRKYFLAMLENQNVGLGPLPKEPEYGARQPEVTQAMMEAWNWLEREGMLIRNPQQPSGEWFTISRSGEKLMQQYVREEQWEKLGVDVVKHDLMNGGLRFRGRPAGKPRSSYGVGATEGKQAARNSGQARLHDTDFGEPPGRVTRA